ncbi:VanZ family protein [Microbacterium sp. SSW1-49]|uniref:VanZ family protein n=1 Tax=Microbacterium croceum TaxID=2851645 RepID=A0ABT0FHT3_9MICO|nr:VanZ family protein [Microbacterium croceum]MCK2037608.1 VanZ family protein [Microbacterium croceum]
MSPMLPAPRRRTRGWALAVGIPFFAGLAILTLTPARVERSMPNLLDLVLGAAHRVGWDSLDFTRLEIIANVLVFVPVGVIAFLFTPRIVWPVALLVGPAISLAIEGAQRVALPHRAATLSDVLANSAGATIGVAIALVCTLLFAPRTAQRESPRVEAS